MDGPMRHRRASWEHKAVPLALAAMVPCQSDFAMFDDFFRSKWSSEKQVEEVEEEQIYDYMLYIVI